MPDIEQYQDASNQSQAIRMLGIVGLAGMPIGPALFLVRSLMVGTATAAIFGVASGMLGGLTIGTATVPFMVGSIAGYTLGTLRWYKTITVEAMMAVDAYPDLLRANLIRNYPHHHHFREAPRSWFCSENMSRTWWLKSMLVTSWMSTLPALDELRQRQENAMIERYAQRNEQKLVRARQQAGQLFEVEETSKAVEGGPSTE